MTAAIKFKGGRGTAERYTSLGWYKECEASVELAGRGSEGPDKAAAAADKHGEGDRGSHLEIGCSADLEIAPVLDDGEDAGEKRCSSKMSRNSSSTGCDPLRSQAAGVQLWNCMLNLGMGCMSWGQAAGCFGALTLPTPIFGLDPRAGLTELLRVSMKQELGAGASVSLMRRGRCFRRPIHHTMDRPSCECHVHRGARIQTRRGGPL